MFRFAHQLHEQIIISVASGVDEVVPLQVSTYGDLQKQGWMDGEIVFLMHLQLQY